MTITRRDGEPFVVTTKKRDDEDREILRLAAQLIAVSLAESSAQFAVRLRVASPWIAVLPPDDQEVFAEEMLTSARACFSLGQMDSRLHTVHAWHETATVVAARWDEAQQRCTDLVLRRRPDRLHRDRRHAPPEPDHVVAERTIPPGAHRRPVIASRP